MTGKKIAVRIDEPCKMKWDNMVPDDTGRYCVSCQKTVVDFRELSDAAIVRLLKSRAKEQVCGHFRSDQLGREMIQPHSEQTSIPLFMKRAAALLLLI